MDARAARAVVVSIGLFMVVGAIFIAGRYLFGIDAGEAGRWFADAASQWYALPATILIFTLLSFVGAPQFALMAAAVLAFGPVQGFLFAWIATQVSAGVNFWLGRLFGADILRRYGGDWANRVSDIVGRNGLWASAMVRIVPAGPFIVVNMAFGVSPTPYWAFFTGTGIGIAPKILVVALTGQSIMAMAAGQGLLLAGAMLLAVAVWIAIMLVARRRLPRSRETAGPEDS
ncbi:MAG: TVP38/TMEM64 family protein [Maricaulaceae bacterium]|nr:TVP38/TMEM64 family protein [Maricaulaceae bacterium]